MCVGIKFIVKTIINNIYCIYKYFEEYEKIILILRSHYCYYHQV